MIELVTLGRAEAFRNGLPLSLPPESPGFLLLVILALDGPRSATSLANLLWPDHPPEKRKAELKAVVDKLQKVLGPGVFGLEEEQLRVDPGRVTIDVERFREAVAGRRAADALAIYRGPFLEELDASVFPEIEQWVEDQRRTLVEMAQWARDYDPWEAQPGPTGVHGLVRKIRSRRIVQVGLLYVGFAVGSLELTNVLVERAVLPHAAFLGLLAFHFVGLPLAVAITWVLGGGGDGGGLRDRLAGSRLRATHLIVIFGVLALGSVAGWFVLQQDRVEVAAPGNGWTALPTDKRIAVIPFRAIGGDAQTADFARGLAANLSDRLSQFEGLRGTLSVIPQVEIREAGVSAPSQAHQQFGANLAITGTLRFNGDSIWVEAELVDAQRVELRRRWALDEPLSDPMAIQNGILSAFQDLLDVELEDWERAALTAGATQNPEAYADQVGASGHLQRFERLENVEEAIRLFERALDRDPEYLLALSGLGKAHLRRYQLTLDPRELELGREAVERALALDDRLAVAHLTLGLTLAATGRHQEALEPLGRAVELEPFSGEALTALGQTWGDLGEPSRAEEKLKLAIELNPDLWIGYNALGTFYNRRARHEEALEQFQKVLEVTPDNARGWTNLGATHFYLGRLEEAEVAFNRSLELGPTDVGFSNLGTLHYHQGRYGEAARAFESALELNERNFALWGHLASTYRQVPDEESRALDAFRRVLELGGSALEVNPRNPDIMLYLASAHANLDEPSRSRALLADALEVAGGHVEVLFRAGETYEQIGDREDAIRWIGEALRNGYPPQLFEQSGALEDLREDPRMRDELAN
ncbi:MAG: tetratricopeptide repeat protein [Gemmatimonadales bacterium]|nr:MAG: tetratricopeptide repeat protein [Gemmatimonadales bacterium]